jgi:hypothetical protein
MSLRDKWDEAQNFSAQFTVNRWQRSLRSIAWIAFLNPEQRQRIIEKHNARLEQEPEYRQIIDLNLEIWQIRDKTAELKDLTAKFRDVTLRFRIENIKLKAEYVALKIGSLFFPNTDRW